MQKRAIFSLFLMICTQTSCVMICHYSVIDKKMTEILYQNYSHFLVEVRGVGPRSKQPYSALSTRLSNDWLFRTSVHSQTSDWWSRDNNNLTEKSGCVVCFYNTDLQGNRKPCVDVPLVNYAARANSILELFWLFFAFNFNFRFYAAEPATCLYRFKLSVESSTPPLRHNQQRRFKVKWL